MAATTNMSLLGNASEPPVRNRLAMSGLFFTTIRLDSDSSQWRTATLNVVEVRNAGIRARWGIGICVSNPQETVLIELMSEEWTFDWLEASKMVIFHRVVPDGSSIRHCILVPDRAAFLVFLSVCSSIKMYTYVGAMPN